MKGSLSGIRFILFSIHFILFGIAFILQLAAFILPHLRSRAERDAGRAGLEREQIGLAVRSALGADGDGSAAPE